MRRLLLAADAQGGVLKVFVEAKRGQVGRDEELCPRRQKAIPLPVKGEAGSGVG